MSNRYLTKIAKMSDESKKEILDTAVIGAGGAIGSTVGDKIAPHIFKDMASRRALKIGVIGGSVGLAMDYGAVKLNKAIDKYLAARNNK